MRAVLGIDAAWTATEPSGVALVVEEADRARCVAVAPSYDAFVRLADGGAIDWSARPAGARPDARALVGAARRLLGGATPLAVAIDMPLSARAITGRRLADDAITRAFVASGCGTYSPTRERPGRLATTLRAGFEAAGFRLATVGRRARPSLLEVYPHPALLALLRADYRIAYKVGRCTRYWPVATRRERIERLLATFRRVLAALGAEIDGVALPLPDGDASLASLKRFEDALDALTCAWVGLKYLRGEARPYGDATAAIWVPDGAGGRAVGDVAAGPRQAVGAASGFRKKKRVVPRGQPGSSPSSS